MLNGLVSPAFTDSAPDAVISKGRRLTRAHAGALFMATCFLFRSPVGLSAPAAIKHVAYAPLSGSQELDLYLPQGAGPFPVIVYIHGGAFRFGDKKEIFGRFSDDIKMLNGMGIGLASINYRMSGEAIFPAAVSDAKAAVRYLRSHAASLALRADAIGVWGKSAGANIALMVGLTPDDPSLYDARLGYAGVSDAVQVVISMYAPTDFLSMDQQLLASPCGRSAATHNSGGSPESAYVGSPIQSARDKARQASPIAYISARAPPILLQAGTADCAVPPQQSQELYDALLPILGPQKLHLVLLAGARHADPVFDEAANLAVVAGFLRDALLKP